jgi:hypothetical protein
MSGVPPRHYTFFHTDQAELEVVAPVAAEAELRGHHVDITTEMDRPTEIGVYCSHEPYLRVADAAVSAVMLHDLGQAHASWPNFWAHESWAAFDVGFLPGRAWVELLGRCEPQVRARLPRCGVFVGGWPKADPYFDAEAGRPHREAPIAAPRVLYAPSWENDLKVDDVVDAALASGAGVLLKLPRTDGQQAWMERYPDTVAAIRDAEDRYLRYGHPDVEVADSRAAIMDVLPGSTVVVSDESCVLLEGLLFDAVPVSVVDWVIPTTGRPASAPYPGVIRTTRALLDETLASVLGDRPYIDGDGRIGTAREFRDLWYSHLGRASAVILDVLDNLVVPPGLTLAPTRSPPATTP